MDHPTGTTGTGPPPVIATDALTKVYPGGVTALGGLTVTVAPGVTGLIGANGAGKSTLIKILLGLIEPTRGTAAVLGRDSVTEGERIRQLVGYMPEHDCLPPDVSATEFVTHMGRMSGIPKTAAKERAAEALRHVGLHEERYRQIGTYSTGMKQRVKLAQALAGDPRLLLLDEPTNGLDPAGRNAMLELIERVGAEFGIPIVVASHLLGEIERICDNIVAIEAGRLLRADSLDSFTTASQTLLIEVEEGTAQLLAELRRQGLAARPYQRALLVAVGAPATPAATPADAAAETADATFDAVRDCVAALGLPLSRVERRRHQVEEIFRDEDQEGQQGQQGDHAEAVNVR
ncbi:MAG TPA: ABC transporter ATP-binding protein [Trebonia sp.]|jgi:ABC-2 type transport system ATP-binding protein|nr:ABC transporter ATP-binding protein [Trebonia sp.]